MFPDIFLADTKILYGYNFVNHLNIDKGDACISQYEIRILNFYVTFSSNLMMLSETPNEYTFLVLLLCFFCWQMEAITALLLLDKKKFFVCSDSRQQIAE